MKIWIEFHNDAGDGEVMHSTMKEELQDGRDDTATRAAHQLYARLGLVLADGEDALIEKFADRMYDCGYCAECEQPNGQPHLSDCPNDEG